MLESRKNTNHLLLLFLALPFMFGCYSITLNFIVNDDGSGSANLYFDYTTSQNGERSEKGLIELLSKKGWTVEGIPVTNGKISTISAHRLFEAGEDLNPIILSVPGFEESKSNISVLVEEDETTRIRRYTLETRLDMSQHKEGWNQAQIISTEGMNMRCEGTVLSTLDAFSNESEQECKIEITPQEMQEMLEVIGPIKFKLGVNLPGVIDSKIGPWTDTENLTYSWEASSGEAFVPLRAVSILYPESEQPDPQTMADSLDTLIDRFILETPAGRTVTNPTAIQNGLAAMFKPGQVNNMTNGTFQACGWWQGEVLKWLDNVRLNPDEKTRTLLAGYDYGPIQAYWGGHQAVVVFPKGTNWMETGMVFDPWPNQIPEVLDINEWRDRFPYGIGVSLDTNDYPHLKGGQSYYPDLRTQANRLHFRRIAVHSPVDVLITTSTGQRIGALPDGSLVNELPLADFYSHPEPDGTTQWYFGLPAGEYDMKLTGNSEGNFHVLVADENGNIVHYGTQPIQTGEIAQLPVSISSHQQPLQLPDGNLVTPQTVTEDYAVRIKVAEQYGSIQQDPPVLSDDRSNLPLGVIGFGGILLGLFCLAIPIAGIVIYILNSSKKPAKDTE